MTHPTGAKAIHDVLVAQNDSVCPAAASASGCPFCQAADGDLGDPEETVAGEKTYTEADVAAAVAKAVADATAPLQTQIDELKQTQTQSEIETAVAAAVEPLQTQLNEAQSALDTATAELKAARDEHTNLVAYLEAEVEREAEDKAKAERKEARLAEVRASKAFDDEYIAANAERFAGYSDEEFESRLVEWKAIAARVPAADADEAELPEKGDKSALTAAAQDTDGAKSTPTKAGSALRSVMTRSGSK